MIAGDVVRVFLMSSMVVAIAVGHITFGQIAVVAFVEGAMYVFFNIAEIGALRSVVQVQQLPAAAAAEQARYSTVSLVAPTLGGALFGIGRMFPFLAGSISPGFSLATLLAIRTPFQQERTVDEAPWRAQLAEGFSFLWARPFLRSCALMFTWTNLAFEGIILAFIVIAKRQGLTSTEIGLLIAGFGACSLVGSVVSPQIQKRLSMRAIVVASLWLQAGTVGFVFDPNIYVLLACTIPMALFFPSVNAVVIGYRVAVTPDRLTGRVNSVARTIALCGAPLGPLAAGVMLGSLSGRETVGVLTAVIAAVAVVGSLLPSIRNAPSLDEIAAFAPTEPVVPELAG
jgi:MFS transporter